MNRMLTLADDTFWVGVNDHETELFEALWPLPYGVSYNATWSWMNRWPSSTR